MVNLGLAEAGSKVNTFVAGTMIETIAMGLMATLFSTSSWHPVSFMAAHNIMSRCPGRQRDLLYCTRILEYCACHRYNCVGVDRRLSGSGLGTFAGVIALTIHSVAALGKLLSEEIEHIDPGPVEAVTATGANLIQTIRYASHSASYAIIPVLFSPALGYQYALRHSYRFCGRRWHWLFRD